MSLENDVTQLKSMIEQAQATAAKAAASVKPIPPVQPIKSAPEVKVAEKKA